MFKYFVLPFAILSISTQVSAIEHHNLTIDNCRILPTGGITIRGTKNNVQRLVTFPKADFSEKVIDRFTSVCVAALASGKLVRIDYLNCINNNCTTSGNTSMDIMK